jgi:hypothetical protein
VFAAALTWIRYVRRPLGALSDAQSVAAG